MAGELKAFHYDLVIWAENAEQADRVMVERVGFEEDLRDQGVGEYSINATPADGREPNPIEVGSAEGSDPS